MIGDLCDILIFPHHQIPKSLVGNFGHLSPGDPKRHEESGEMMSDTEEKVMI